MMTEIGMPINHNKTHLVSSLLFTLECQENAETN